MMRNSRAFTLVELLIVIAVAAILMMIAAPSFRDFILLQRLKGIHAQLMTDIQFARSEAAAWAVPVRLSFAKNDQVTCYTLYTGTRGDCSCLANPVCPEMNGVREVRTVRTPMNLSVSVVVPSIAGIDSMVDFAFDPATGGVEIPRSDLRGERPRQVNVDVMIDGSRTIRTKVGTSGRPGACAPVGSTLGTSMGLPPC